MGGVWCLQASKWMGSCSLAGVDEGVVLDADNKRYKIGKMKRVVGGNYQFTRRAGEEILRWDEVQYCNWRNNYQLWKLRIEKRKIFLTF